MPDLSKHPKEEERPGGGALGLSDSLTTVTELVAMPPKINPKADNLNTRPVRMADAMAKASDHPLAPVDIRLACGDLAIRALHDAELAMSVDPAQPEWVTNLIIREGDFVERTGFLDHEMTELVGFLAGCGFADIDAHGLIWPSVRWRDVPDLVAHANHMLMHFPVLREHLACPRVAEWTLHA